MCILLNVKKHEKTFALNVDIFNHINKNVLILTMNYASDIVKLTFNSTK